MNLAQSLGVAAAAMVLGVSNGGVETQMLAQHAIGAIDRAHHQIANLSLRAQMMRGNLNHAHSADPCA